MGGQLDLFLPAAGPVVRIGADTIDATRLPHAAGSIAAIVFDEAARGAGGLDRHRLPRAVDAWRRGLAPQGRLVLGIAGSSISRRLRRGRAIAGRLGVRNTLRALRQAGFTDVRLYAPLPDEADARLVLPVDDRAIVRYCLDRMLRRNSLASRLAIASARLANATGALRWGLPYYYVVAARGSDPT